MGYDFNFHVPKGVSLTYMLTQDENLLTAFRDSVRVCTLYVSQNVPGMYESVGGEAGRHIIDSLLGNLRLKILCAQDAPVTCQWQSELWGKTKRLLFNSSCQTNQDISFDLFRPRRQQSGGFSESWEWARNFRTG